ncbi:MAG TPA: hypothetical protein VE622_04980 [Nitrososphaeraceae archaeon]|nr:hypothetical protein [Nitrososphaeraceae archaeon]
MSRKRLLRDLQRRRRIKRIISCEYREVTPCETEMNAIKRQLVYFKQQSLSTYDLAAEGEGIVAELTINILTSLFSYCARSSIHGSNRGLVLSILTI